MTDKILETKKEMKRILKNKGLTRIERFDLAKEKSELLDEKERKILEKECRRDYESYNRIEDIKELITLGLTGLGLIITLFGIFFDDVAMTFEQFSNIVYNVTIFVIIMLAVLSFTQQYRSRNMFITKYMLDILEEE